ncbi:HEPN domain-containing protein [bacterium]|nr:HEPN domain-containing protein [bacterium]
MKPLTAEWIDKAESDFAVMERESRVRKNPAYDVVCFHAQQCVEKYLKARLCHADEEAGRLHDLVALLERVLAREPLWETFRVDLAYLSDFAVAYRYPGESSTREQARDAVGRCRRFRLVARQALGVP